MKKLLIILAAVICMSIAPAALADDSEVIDLIPVKVEEPKAVPDPRPVEIISHELDPEDVEKLARLLWSSPLRDEENKKLLCYVVMNRADHGEPFGDTIQSCINLREFAFFDSHAHRSEANLRIAREAMNEWLSRKEGRNVGKVIPINAFYIQFCGENNRKIRLLDIDMQPLWR